MVSQLGRESMRFRRSVDNNTAEHRPKLRASIKNAIELKFDSIILGCLTKQNDNSTAHMIRKYADHNASTQR